MKTTKLSPKAVKIARRVQKLISNEYMRYDQADYAKRTSRSPCGAAACLAGWTDIARLDQPVTKSLVQNWLNKVLEHEQDGTVSYHITTRFGSYIHDRARKALGLTEDQANRLFSGDPGALWPEPFCSKWKRAGTRKAQAKVAVALLEELIKKGPSILHVWDAS